MNWLNHIDKTFVINLPHRVDRLERSTEQLNAYEIPFERYEAIKHEQGAIGLVLTMKQLFNECLQRGYKTVLVFEDDFEFVVGKDTVNETMNGAFEWLKNNDWGLFYLGLQHPVMFERFITKNILPVKCGYATHALIWREEAMRFVVEMDIQEPIDNFLVREYQPFLKCYCSYPLLATQRTNYSDIYETEMNWDMYISNRFTENVRHLL